MKQQVIAELLHANRRDLAMQVARQVVTASDPTTLLHKFVPGIGGKIKLVRYKQEPDGTKYWLEGLPKRMRDARSSLDLFAKKYGIETDYIDEKRRGDPATLIVWVPLGPKLDAKTTTEQLEQALTEAARAYSDGVQKAIKKIVGDTGFDPAPLLQTADQMVNKAVTALPKKMATMLKQQAKG